MTVKNTVRKLILPTGSVITFNKWKDENRFTFQVRASNSCRYNKNLIINGRMLKRFWRLDDGGTGFGDSNTNLKLVYSTIYIT